MYMYVLVGEDAGVGCGHEHGPWLVIEGHVTLGHEPARGPAQHQQALLHPHAHLRTTPQHAEGVSA